MKLQAIQSELKAPKNQYNSFGKYKYRSCEDILEALKPLLKEHNCALIVSDEVVMLGSRFYVKATVTLKTGDQEEGDYVVSACARESDTKKGMDEAQITGAASSYARKYALQGLFALDDADSKDPDTQNNTEKEEVKKETTRIQSDHIARINACLSVPELNECMEKIKGEMGSSFSKFRNNFIQHYNRRKEEIMRETEGMGL